MVNTKSESSVVPLSAEAAVQGRRCVITLGVSELPPVGHPEIVRDFRLGIKRLESSLAASGYSGAFASWDSDYPKGSPTHAQSPYAFKPFCFVEAEAAGYDVILWLDATIQVVRSINPMFRSIEEDGYLIFAEEHSVGEYCKDEALSTLGLVREASFSMPSCWACAIGLDLRKDVAKEFLRQWKELAVDGKTFPGPRWSGVRGFPKVASADERVKGHRHDQTAASVVALRLGMTKWKPKSSFYRYLRNERRWVPTMSPTQLNRERRGTSSASEKRGSNRDEVAHVLFFSRGRGRGHAVPDIAIAEELSQLSGDMDVQFVSYGTGADAIRSDGWSVIDLGLPEANPFVHTLVVAHALIAELRPTVVVAHEEFAVLPAAQMAGVPTVLITDWFPPANHGAGESVAFADSIIFLGECGVFPLPVPIRNRPLYVGPIVKKMKFTLKDRQKIRADLGISETAFVVAVIPGAWATEARAPIAATVLQAFRQLSIREKCLFWLSKSDFDLLNQQSAERADIRVMKDCSSVEQIIVASDLIITKGNRGTIMDAASLGVPSISLTQGANPIDDILVARIRSNVALHAEAVDSAMLCDYMERQLAARSTACPVPLDLHIRGGADAARALIKEIRRLCPARLPATHSGSTELDGGQVPIETAQLSHYANASE